VRSASDQHATAGRTTIRTTQPINESRDRPRGLLGEKEVRVVDPSLLSPSEVPLVPSCPPSCLGAEAPQPSGEPPLLRLACLPESFTTSGIGLLVHRPPYDLPRPLGSSPTWLRPEIVKSPAPASPRLGPPFRVFPGPTAIPAAARRLPLLRFSPLQRYQCREPTPLGLASPDSLRLRGFSPP
jgi:hypothetical protein